MKRAAMATIEFVNARLVGSGSACTPALSRVLVSAGKIAVIDPPASALAAAGPKVTIDCKGAYLAPGFIDIQCNGGYGIDYTDPTLKSADILHVGHALLSHGVTAICPTLISAPTELYKRNIPMASRMVMLLKSQRACNRREWLLTVPARSRVVPEGWTPLQADTGMSGGLAIPFDCSSSKLARPWNKAAASPPSECWVCTSRGLSCSQPSVARTRRIS